MSSAARWTRFDNRFVFGEFSEEFERSGGYLAPDKGLHAGYNFALAGFARATPAAIREHFETLARIPDHWPCIAFSNHDVMRTVTRFGAPKDRPKLMLGAVVRLRGTTLLYQGEELGLPEVDVARDQLKDPVGDLYYPLLKGRDGCRTPMPWDGDAPNLGFTTGTPWLPVSPLHQPLAVTAQEIDPQSTLQFARGALAARRKSAALRLGDIAFLEAPGEVLAFERTHENKTVLCVFNLGKAQASFRDPRLAHAKPLIVAGDARSEGAQLSLGLFGAWVGDL